MSLRNVSVPLRWSFRHSSLIQGSLLIGFWIVGESMVRAAHLPVPGGILGLACVLFLLLSGRISVANLRRGAHWLLADMLLFFIPAVLAVLNHEEFLGIIGLKLLAVVVLGTFFVMGGTALVVDLCCRVVYRDPVE